MKSIKGLHLPIEKAWAKNVFWMYGVLLDKEFGLNRNECMRRLKQAEVETRSFFVPMHLQPVYDPKTRRARNFGPFPVAERISEQGFYLPSGLAITRDQIHYVCQQVKSLVE